MFHCRGRFSLSSRNGKPFGSEGFDYVVENSVHTPWMKVTVPLSAAGRTALLEGAIVGVEAEPLSSEFRYPSAGYRTFLGGSPEGR